MERQRRVIAEHQVTFSALRRGVDEAPKSFHDGPGEGELYNPCPQKSLAPGKRSPRKLQSIVRVVPRPIRPRLQQRPWHRSPLDGWRYRVNTTYSCYEYLFIIFVIISRSIS